MNIHLIGTATAYYGNSVIVNQATVGGNDCSTFTSASVLTFQGLRASTFWIKQFIAAGNAGYLIASGVLQ